MSQSGLLVLLLFFTASVQATALPGFFSKWVGGEVARNPIDSEDGSRDFMTTEVYQRVLPLGKNEYSNLGIVTYVNYPSEGSEISNSGKDWFKKIETIYRLKNVQTAKIDDIYYFIGSEARTFQNVIGTIAYRKNRIHFSVGFYRKAYEYEAAPEFLMIQSMLVGEKITKTSFFKNFSILNEAYAQNEVPDLAGLVESAKKIEKLANQLEGLNLKGLEALSSLDPNAIKTINALGSFSISADTGNQFTDFVKNAGNWISGFELPNKQGLMVKAAIGIAGIQIIKAATNGTISGLSESLNVLYQYLSGKKKIEQENQMYGAFQKVFDEEAILAKKKNDIEEVLVKFTNTFKDGKPLSFYFLEDRVAMIERKRKIILAKEDLNEIAQVKASKANWLPGSRTDQINRLACTTEDIDKSILALNQEIQRIDTAMEMSGKTYKGLCSQMMSLPEQLRKIELEQEKSAQNGLYFSDLAMKKLLRAKKKLVKDLKKSDKKTSEFLKNEIENKVSNIELSKKSEKENQIILFQRCPSCKSKTASLEGEFQSVISDMEIKNLKNMSGDKLGQLSGEIESKADKLVAKLESGIKELEGQTSPEALSIREFYKGMITQSKNYVDEVESIYISWNLSKDPNYDLNKNNMALTDIEIKLFENFTIRLKERRSGMKGRIRVDSSGKNMDVQKVDGMVENMQKYDTYEKKVAQICMDYSKNLSDDQKKILELGIIPQENSSNTDPEEFYKSLTNALKEINENDLKKILEEEKRNKEDPWVEDKKQEASKSESDNSTKKQVVPNNKEVTPSSSRVINKNGKTVNASSSSPGW